MTGDRSMSWTAAARSVTPPPHGLSRGKRCLSSKRTEAPCSASSRATVLPEGPAPATTASWVAIALSLFDDSSGAHLGDHRVGDYAVAGVVRVNRVAGDVFVRLAFEERIHLHQVNAVRLRLAADDVLQSFGKRRIGPAFKRKFAQLVQDR